MADPVRPLQLYALLPQPLLEPGQQPGYGTDRGGPGALLEESSLRRTHRLHAVRAHLLERAGRADEARAAYAEAARLATSVPERRYLQARADG